MKKKICIVTTIAGTIKSFLIGQITFLSENGYDVTVICNNDEELKKILKGDIQYIPINMKRGVSFFNTFKSIYKLVRVFNKNKYDLVQYSTPNAAFCASIAAKLSNIPTRLYCQWGLRYIGFNGVRRIIFKNIERIICKLSTYIEPDSNSNLEFCRKEKFYGNKKSSVVWNGSANGINSERFNINEKKQWREEIRALYDISEKEFTFGFVGSIKRDKGINELIAAFKLFKEEGIDKIKLLLVGDENQVVTLDKELLSWSKQCKDIIYCGRTNYVEKYMAAMDTFILPSYREGFGSVVVEAEAMGVPVIVSNIPGPVDAILEDVTGILVEPKDVASLKSGMYKVYKDDVLRSKMGEEGRNFAIDRFEQKKLYQFILADRNRLIYDVINQVMEYEK